MYRIIILIFVLAVVVRFLYFPNNIYFGYDQARDSLISLEIFKGNLKLIGPPSSVNENLFHGPLIYYIYSPIYLLSANNPEAVAGVFRILNVLGVILVFLLGKTIFNKNVGIITALLFAISYEQTQYSLFISHPALAILGVLIFYLGLSYYVFKDKGWGLILASFGYGLAIQFHYVHLFLGITLIPIFFLFKEKVIIKKWKLYILSFVTFLLTVSTFILAEIKFNFRETKFFLNPGNNNLDFSQILIISKRAINDNLVAQDSFVVLLLVIIILSVIYLLRIKYTRRKIIFLIIWFIVGFIPYILSRSTSYYYNAGASVSLLIFVAFLLDSLPKKYFILVYFCLGTLIFSNIFLIINQNYKGPSKDIVIQPGMLTSSERQVLDYVYLKSAGQPFAVNALTVPLNVNTTWDYLFNWYGKGRYGYLPVWGGESAIGFPGMLTIINDRSKLPNMRFTIIEPTIGIEEGQISDFFRNENYFSKVVEEKYFGTIKVQVRERI